MFQMKLLLAGLLLLALAHTATFDIKSVSTCTQQSSQGFCTRWEQNGSVQETTGCFPSNAEVYVLQEGTVKSIPLKDLKIGDKILAQEDGEQIYSEIRGWLHKNSTLEYEFLEINTESGSFVVSDMHSVKLLSGEYAFAKDLQGSYLSNGEKVTKIGTKKAAGVYAPFTNSGNFYVKVGDSSRTLAHCFAYIDDPEFYEPFVSTIFSLWELYYGQPTQQYVIHPSVEWMISTFNFLLEKQ